MSTREIVGHLHESYGIDVSPDLISTVTDAVLDEVATWQQRPLDAIYPLVFFDAILVKICDAPAACAQVVGSQSVFGLPSSCVSFSFVEPNGIVAGAISTYERCLQSE